MFSFLKKKVELVDLPIEEIKFTAEDLFVLMGGLDICGVAINGRKFPWREVTQGGLSEKWRKQVVNRYEPSGLVGGDGRPTGKLAEILEPFTAPGLGIQATAGGNLQRFDVEMAIHGDRASILRVAPGGRLFTVASAGSREAWGQAFSRAVGLEGRFAPAKCSWHCDFLSAPGDPLVNELIFSGNADAARSLAESKGFDAAPLVEIAESVGRSRSVDGLKITTVDNRNVDLSTVSTPQGSFTSPVPSAESPIDMRVKRMSVYPEFGFVLSETTAPREGLPADWREHGSEYRYQSRFFSCDLLDTPDLFSFVTDVRDCPTELGGIPSGQPLGSILEL